MKTINKIAIGGVAAGVAGMAAGVGMILAGRSAWKRLRNWGAQELYGQTVLITGGSRGLGLALAEEFARQGCNIVICAREEDELIRARQQVERLGVEVVAVPCDISKPDEVEHMVNVARQHFGKIDVLVNNAGIISVGPLLSQKLEDFQEAMDVMFWGVVHPTLAVLPQMLHDGRGRVVNITSIGGKVSVPHLLPYDCAKFAAVGFSEGLHAEVGRFGVNVTTVVPGLMRTGSYVNANFKGNNEAEYSWFSVSSALPLLTIAADRAARKIIRAVRQGRAEIILTPQARLLATAHGVAPGLVSDALSLVNRMLPDATQDNEKHLGKDSRTAVSESFLTTFGRRAAEQFNETPEQKTALQSGTA